MLRPTLGLGLLAAVIGTITLKPRLHWGRILMGSSGEITAFGAPELKIATRLE
jgi:hypothetical protein